MGVLCDITARETGHYFGQKWEGWMNRQLIAGPRTGDRVTLKPQTTPGSDYFIVLAPPSSVILSYNKPKSLEKSWKS
jgi:hypothetical protein